MLVFIVVRYAIHPQINSYTIISFEHILEQIFDTTESSVTKLDDNVALED